MVRLTQKYYYWANQRFYDVLEIRDKTWDGTEAPHYIAIRNVAFNERYSEQSSNLNVHNKIRLDCFKLIS